MRIISVCFICLLLVNCKGRINYLNDDILCVCILSSTASCDTYVWEVHKDGQLRAYLGEINSSVLHAIVNNERVYLNKMKALEKTDRQVSKKLSPEEMNRIEEYCKLLKRMPYINDFYPGWWNDAWLTASFVENRQFFFELGNQKDNNYSKLVRYLIEISPIDVYLHRSVRHKIRITEPSQEANDEYYSE